MYACFAPIAISCTSCLLFCALDVYQHSDSYILAGTEHGVRINCMTCRVWSADDGVYEHRGGGVGTAGLLQEYSPLSPVHRKAASVLHALTPMINVYFRSFLWLIPHPGRYTCIYPSHCTRILPHLVRTRHRSASTVRTTGTKGTRTAHTNN